MNLQDYITESYASKELTDEESKKLIINIKRLYRLGEKKQAEEYLERLNYVRKAEGKTKIPMYWLIKTPNGEALRSLRSRPVDPWGDSEEDSYEYKSIEDDREGSLSLGDSLSYDMAETILSKEGFKKIKNYDILRPGDLITIANGKTTRYEGNIKKVEDKFLFMGETNTKVKRIDVLKYGWVKKQEEYKPGYEKLTRQTKVDEGDIISFNNSLYYVVGVLGGKLYKLKKIQKETDTSKDGSNDGLYENAYLRQKKALIKKGIPKTKEDAPKTKTVIFKNDGNNIEAILVDTLEDENGNKEYKIKYNDETGKVVYKIVPKDSIKLIEERVAKVDMLVEGITFFKHSNRLKKFANDIYAKLQNISNEKERTEIEKLITKINKLADKFEVVEKKYKSDKKIAKEQYKNLILEYKDMLKIVKKEEVKKILKVIGQYGTLIAAMTLPTLLITQLIKRYGTKNELTGITELNPFVKAGAYIGSSALIRGLNPTMTIEKNMNKNVVGKTYDVLKDKEIN